MRVKVSIPKDRKRYRVDYIWQDATCWTHVIAKTPERAKNKFLRNFPASRIVEINFVEGDI